MGPVKHLSFLVLLFIPALAGCARTETKPADANHYVAAITHAGTDRESKASAIHKLQENGDWKLLADCLEPLNNSKDMSTLADVIIAIGDIGDPSALPELMKFGPILCDTNEYVNELATLLDGVAEELIRLRNEQDPEKVQDQRTNQLR